MTKREIITGLYKQLETIATDYKFQQFDIIKRYYEKSIMSFIEATTLYYGRAFLNGLDAIKLKIKADWYYAIKSGISWPEPSEELINKVAPIIYKILDTVGKDAVQQAVIKLQQESKSSP